MLFDFHGIKFCEFIFKVTLYIHLYIRAGVKAATVLLQGLLARLVDGRERLSEI